MPSLQAFPLETSLGLSVSRSGQTLLLLPLLVFECCPGCDVGPHKRIRHRTGRMLMQLPLLLFGCCPYMWDFV